MIAPPSRSRVACLLASLVLVMAAARPSPAQPPAEALVGEIPFHPGSPPTRVMIDLAPDGQQPFVMMLDTGAAGSVMTPGMARALGVNVRRTRSTHYRKRTRLGRDLLFWVDTSWSDTAPGGAGWDYGLLGGDFLDDYVVEIDYPGRTVRFYDPDRYEVPEQASRPDEAVLPFRRSGTRILVELEVEGKPLRTLLDTGAPGVILSGREAKKAGIGWDDLPELDGMSATAGPIAAHTYEAERLRWAGFEFQEQPIVIAPRGIYNFGGPTDSALGYDVLQRFVMRIDYSERRIWLKSGEVYARSFLGSPLVDPGPTVASPSPEEVAENDARIEAEWHEEKDTRRYAETPGGGFVVVEGYRLREGPKEGEVWYTHEEMLERRRELETDPEAR